ncbi:hypothetical protein EMGBS15_05160 [Filimonas sp.]|nr:hypothetical protein EMGBS15_05160 [Filimonas sp.]
MSATRYYRAVVRSGVCASTTNSSVVITVNPASVAGSISGSTTVCTGINSSLLTLSGQTGTIQWQSSSDNISFNDIIGETTTTYTATNLNATTYYHAVVTSGVCASAITASAIVTVNPASVAGTISGATTVVQVPFYFIDIKRKYRVYTMAIIAEQYIVHQYQWCHKCNVYSHQPDSNKILSCGRYKRCLFISHHIQCSNHRNTGLGCR